MSVTSLQVNSCRAGCDMPLSNRLKAVNEDFFSTFRIPASQKRSKFSTSRWSDAGNVFSVSGIRESGIRESGGATSVLVSVLSGVCTVQTPDNTDTSTEVAPPDSLIPDSLIPDTEKTLPASDHLDVENFERFWEAGMRKVEKKSSFTAFRRLLKGMSQPARHEFTCKLVTDIKKRIALNQFGFDSLHPTTYLNGERWNDEYPLPESRASPGKSNLFDLTRQNYESGDL